MADKMTVDQKAEALVEMGLVRITQFDVLFRVIGCEVAARNLDTASVEYSRGRGVLYITQCQHKTREGERHGCEGHEHGHVCYHARAGLMMGAKVAGRSLTFHKTEAEARQHCNMDPAYAGNMVCKVMVAGHEGKAVFAALNKG